MERAVKVFAAHFKSYLDRATDCVTAANIAGYAGVPREVLRPLIGRSAT